MKIVTISSSLRFIDLVHQAIKAFRISGVTAYFPNLKEVKSNNISHKVLRKLYFDHFVAIDKSEALYVICPEGYVGTQVAVEIGYALGQGKKIIFSEKPADLGLQAIASRYLALDQIAKSSIRTHPV